MSNVFVVSVHNSTIRDRRKVARPAKRKRCLVIIEYSRYIILGLPDSMKLLSIVLKAVSLGTSRAKKKLLMEERASRVGGVVQNSTVSPLRAADYR
jgi:hypothetical protein